MTSTRRAVGELRPVLRGVIHLVRLVVGAGRYALATRRFSLVAVIVVGLILIALTATAQTTAPLLLYPFA